MEERFSGKEKGKKIEKKPLKQNRPSNKANM